MVIETDRFVYQDRELKLGFLKKKGPSVHTAAAILNLTAAILDSPLSHMLPHVSLNIGREGERDQKKRKKEKECESKPYEN